MKTYRLQCLIDRDWCDVPNVKSQSIKYMHGYQDATQACKPFSATRIVWVRGCKVEVVRVRNRIAKEAT